MAERGEERERETKETKAKGGEKNECKTKNNDADENESLCNLEGQRDTKEEL